MSPISVHSRKITSRKTAHAHGFGSPLARGLINSREHLESLFEAKRLGVASVQDYLEAHHQDRAA